MVLPMRELVLVMIRLSFALWALQSDIVFSLLSSMSSAILSQALLILDITLEPTITKRRLTSIQALVLLVEGLS